MSDAGDGGEVGAVEGGDGSVTDQREAGVNCQSQLACEVDFASASIQPAAELAGFCAQELYPEHPGAGLYGVCVVSPAGRVFLLILGGTMEIVAPGWTHSFYGNGLFPSTLTAADEDRCADAFQIRYDESQNEGGVCPWLIGQ